MPRLRKLSKISWKSSSPFIPYNSINDALLSNIKIEDDLNRVKDIVKKNPLPPYSYDRSYLLKVAKLFNIKLLFEADGKQKMGGFCDAKKNKIKIFFTKDYTYNKKILTHELGHIIQFKFGVLKVKGPVILSEEVKTEQQADTISYYLYKSLWPKESIPKNYFHNYFTEEDIIWLHQYYADEDDYINDLFDFNDKKKNRRK